jgi:predicted MFS family arabinose efflux permease
MIRRHLPTLPATQAGRAFVFVAIVDSLGTGFFLAGSALFFVLSVGLSAPQVGLGLGLASLVAFFLTVPVSAIGDSVGPKRMLIGLHLWRACWFSMLAFTTGPLAFTLVATMISIADRGVSPLTRAVVSAAVGEADRTATLALMRSIRNVGFSLGAALAAPLIALHTRSGYQAVILLDALSFALAALALRRVRLGSAPTGKRKPNPIAASLAFRDPRYLLLTVSDGVLTLHVSLLGIAIPLWAIQQTGAPPELVPCLILANTVLAVLFQVRVARGADGMEGGLRAMRRSAASLAVCCLVMAVAWHTPTVPAALLLIVATVAMTGGELWEAVGSWTLSYRYAQDDQMSQYLAVFSLGLAAQEVVGPLLVAGLVLTNGPLGWLCLSAVFVSLRLLLPRLVRRLEEDSFRPPESEAQMVSEGGGLMTAEGSPT